jgi:hypothetical protein
MRLADHIGKLISIRSSALNTALGETGDKWTKVKLISIEAGGLLIESQELINRSLQRAGVGAALTTPLLFLPYHEILLCVVSAEGPALEEKGLGV